MIGAELPTLTRHLEPVDMSKDLKEAYEKLDRELSAAVKNKAYKGKGPPAVAALRITKLDEYLDHPWAWDPICARKYDAKTHEYLCEEQIAWPREIGVLHEDAKDKKLVEIIKAQRARNRKCAVYVQFVGDHDVRPKIAAMLRRNGIRACIPGPSFDNKPAMREEWIAQHEHEFDVLLVNPRKVMTGLDLLGFPTLIFYQIGMSTHVLRQAGARARRPSQTQACENYYIFYKQTVQEKAMALMGEKEAASLALEGVFDTAALRALMNGGQDSDILSALAHSMDDEEIDVAAAWKKVQDAERALTDTHRKPESETVFPTEDLFDLLGDETLEPKQETEAVGSVQSSFF